jgi:thioesterase domain-containing protein
LSQLAAKVSSKNLSSLEKDKEVSVTEKWMNLMMDGVLDENTNLVTADMIVKANDVEDNLRTKVLIIPGLIGYAANIYRNLAKQIDYPAYILQMVGQIKCKSLDDIMDVIIENILNLYLNVDNFILIGHSFGSILTLKIGNILENIGKRGQIIQIDGSPEFVKRFAFQSIRNENMTNFHNYILKILFDISKSFVDSAIIKSVIENNSNWENRLKAVIEASGRSNIVSYDKMVEEVSTAFTNRLNISHNIKIEEFDVLEFTKISLIKATKAAVPGLPEDYGLSLFSSGNIYITFVVGDHASMMENLDLSGVITRLIST